MLYRRIIFADAVGVRSHLFCLFCAAFGACVWAETPFSANVAPADAMLEQPSAPIPAAVPAAAPSAAQPLEAKRISRGPLHQRVTESNTTGPQATNALSATPSVWRTLGSLILVLVLIVAVTYAFRRWALKTPQARLGAGIDILTRNAVNPRQSLCLIRVGSRMILLGVSPNQITNLCTIEDPDELAHIQGLLEKNGSSSVTRSFEKLFHRQTQDYQLTEEDPAAFNLENDDATNQQWHHAKGELSQLLDKVKGLTKIRLRS